MTIIEILGTNLAVAVGVGLLLFKRFQRLEDVGSERQAVAEELRKFRQESQEGIRAFAEGLQTTFLGFVDSQSKSLDVANKSIAEGVLKITSGAEAASKRLEERFDVFRKESERGGADLLKNHIESQRTTREELALHNRGLVETQSKSQTDLRALLEKKLAELQAANEKKLEEMRATVDEKLQGTLEKRLGESFKLVSERLELVHRGLGEMQGLSTNVNDLRKAFANVKTRGIWGEVQLEAILSDMFAPDQFVKNAKIRPSSNDTVEFAVKIPQKDEDGKHLLLPIDSKFPQEDFLRMVEASEKGDVAALADARAALLVRIELEAKSIAAKYIDPPNSTDFAVMFVPTESMYAEILREPGMYEKILTKHRVSICGPTNLSAILMSIKHGFRAIAVEKRAAEVWKTLGAVKTEFGKFGGVLDKLGKKLDEARSNIDSAAQRTRAMERQLRNVEELPTAEATEVLMLGAQDEPSSEVT